MFQQQRSQNLSQHHLHHQIIMVMVILIFIINTISNQSNRLLPYSILFFMWLKKFGDFVLVKRYNCLLMIVTFLLLRIIWLHRFPVTLCITVIDNVILQIKLHKYEYFGERLVGLVNWSRTLSNLTFIDSFHQLWNIQSCTVR